MTETGNFSTESPTPLSRKLAFQFGVVHLLAAMALTAALMLTIQKSIFETQVVCFALGLFCVFCNCIAFIIHFLLKRSMRTAVIATFSVSLVLMVIVWLLQCWRFPKWNNEWMTPDRILVLLLLVPAAASGAVTSVVTLLILDRRKTQS